MTRHRMRRTAALLALGLAVPVLLVAVSERHFFEVEHKGERELEANLDIALGNVIVGRADDGYLFQAEVVLENDKLVPDFSYHVDRRVGRLDVDMTTLKDKKDAVSIPDIGKVKESEWKLYFGNEAPIDLKMELAGTVSDLDFSGIPLSRLQIEIEASKGTIRFDDENPVAMDYMHIESGASELQIIGLGNTRAQHMRFEGGMGSFALDFTGEHAARPGTIADIEIGMASLDITLPSKGPVVLYVPDSWFCSVNVPNGYIKHDKGVYGSPDYRTGKDAFTVKVEAGVGSINFAVRS